ncbi:MAG TPA: hypothetical protein VFA93_01355 [Patescibacteria group bacterium]|nr:hypothetical protein [Patescibacteria group bacterium]
MPVGLVKFLTAKSTVLFALIAATMLTAGSFSLYLNDEKQLAQIKKNPQFLAQQEAKDIVSKVGALVALPTDEQPTIATVTDVSKLKGQAFFAKAQNGDKVLIYTKALKAYLYSVTLNKILEVAPVTVNQNPGQVAGVKTETPTPAPKK